MNRTNWIEGRKSHDNSFKAGQRFEWHDRIGTGEEYELVERIALTTWSAKAWSYDGGTYAVAEITEDVLRNHYVRRKRMFRGEEI